MGHYIFSQQAETDFNQIVDYIWQDSPQSADRFTDEIERVCSLLGDMPQMGSGVEFIKSPEYYVFPAGKFRSYLIFYLIEEDTPVIVRILHGRRELEKLLEDED